MSLTLLTRALESFYRGCVMDFADSPDAGVISGSMKTTKKPPGTEGKGQRVNIITAAVLRAGMALGAKQRGDRLLPECIVLLTAHFKKMRPTFSRATIYNWIKVGHMKKVDLGDVRALAELADMKLEQFTGEDEVETDKPDNGEESG